MLRPKLIFIGGEAWTGKTACADALYRRFQNSACLDGDHVWRVHPWSLKDPRLRTSDVNAAFVLRTYLRSGFEYVVFSSITLCVPAITERILARISGVEYEFLHFTLFADRHTLMERGVQRDGSKPTSFRFLARSLELDTIKIDTTRRSVEQVVDQMATIVRSPVEAGLRQTQTDTRTEWRPEGSQAEHDGAQDGVSADALPPPVS